MTGFEFLDELNKLNIMEDQIDILMLSSNRPAHYEKTLNKKCFAYIEKPLTSDKLLVQLENIYGQENFNKIAG